MWLKSASPFLRTHFVVLLSVPLAIVYIELAWDQVYHFNVSRVSWN